MIHYKKRRKYKYNLQSDLIYETEINVENPMDMGLLEIESNGKLIIRKGYSWDGPSGPTIDTRNFMQGSLIHDALYQLIREGVLPPREKKRADDILHEICRKDGMSKIRAWYVHLAVKYFGSGSIKPDLKTAP